MPIEAIIMAGGEGSRLRPLTLNRPKPLVPILGKPCMWYALELLKRHGLNHAAATLCYMPNAVKEAFGGELQYYEETVPLGTAGSVRMAKDDVADTFVILSGDGLTDCDLTDALRFHREKGAMATLVLKPMPVPLSYGVVLTDGTGRITSFLEKPDWSQVFSDQVNTGIYILNKQVLDRVPQDRPYDFGHDLFPKMVQEGLPVFGYVMQGYWCDVGDQAAYLKAQLDVMAGLVDLPVEIKRQGLVYMEEGAFFHEGARAQGLCYVGKNARVERGAILYEGTALCENAIVHQGARLERTCLFENAVAGCLTHLRGAVLCEDSIAHENVTMEEDTALGRAAEAMKGAVLAPGVKIWPYRLVAQDAHVYENVVWGDLKAATITQSKCTISVPRQADALCGAIGEVLKPRRGLVMHDGQSESLSYTLAGALTAYGMWVVRVDGGTYPAMRSLQAHFHCKAGFFVSGDTVYMTGEGGQPLSKAEQRKVEALMLRQDYPLQAKRKGECTTLSGGADLYADVLSSHLLLDKATRAAVFCENPFVRKVVESIVGRMGCDYVRVCDESDLGLLNDELGLLISDFADTTFIVTKEGIQSAATQQLLAHHAWFSTGHDTLFLLSDAPRGVLKAAPEGARILPLTQKDEAPDIYRTQTAVFSDGILMALMLMQAFPNLERAQQALRGIPAMHLYEAEVPCPTNKKGRVLRMLGDGASDKEMDEGLRVYLEKGIAHMVPSPDRAIFRVTAESSDAEFAREICDLYQKDIERILGNL